MLMSITYKIIRIIIKNIVTPFCNLFFSTTYLSKFLNNRKKTKSFK